MKNFMAKTFGKLAIFSRKENGNATIEFALLFPVFFMLLLLVVENAMVMARGVMLDRAIDIAVRDLRLGKLTPMTHEGLKARVCENAVIFPDCHNSVLIELRTSGKKNWVPASATAQCVDRREDIQPAVSFTNGSKNELMLITACAVFDPFFPSTALAAQMKLDETGAYALVSRTAYVNEP